jgi:hypothetical protein
MQLCKLSTSCVRTACMFPVVATSLEQPVCNLKQAWFHYQTARLQSYIFYLTSLIQSWYNKNVTRLTTQGCNNVVISRLYIGLVGTTLKHVQLNLMISTRLLQVVNSLLFQTCWQYGQAVWTQRIDGLLGDLLQDVRFFRV